MKTIPEMRQTVRDTLYGYNLHKLKEVLKLHDKWFLSWEEPDLREERQKVNEDDKKCIIDWIMETDPIIVEGGLFDFLKHVEVF